MTMCKYGGNFSTPKPVAKPEAKPVNKITGFLEDVKDLIDKYHNEEDDKNVDIHSVALVLAEKLSPIQLDMLVKVLTMTRGASDLLNELTQRDLLNKLTHRK
ncbi:MAG TPA: hypothetical protein VMX17_07935 [Candidatus Glassbacteria bacterium]|nr:hypothetical protein [Candidatus Glassbacteria bacterium]